MICTADCAARCQCNKGFTKDEVSGECVKTCPTKNVECLGDLEWKDCLVCFQQCGEPMMCMGVHEDGVCPGGCTCPKGRVKYSCIFLMKNFI